MTIKSSYINKSKNILNALITGFMNIISTTWNFLSYIFLIFISKFVNTISNYIFSEKKEKPATVKTDLAPTDNKELGEEIDLSTFYYTDPTDGKTKQYIYHSDDEDSVSLDLLENDREEKFSNDLNLFIIKLDNDLKDLSQSSKSINDFFYNNISAIGRGENRKKRNNVIKNNFGEFKNQVENNIKLGLYKQDCLTSQQFEKAVKGSNFLSQLEKNLLFGTELSNPLSSKKQLQPKSENV